MIEAKNLRDRCAFKLDNEIQMREIEARQTSTSIKLLKDGNEALTNANKTVTVVNNEKNVITRSNDYSHQYQVDR